MDLDQIHQIRVDNCTRLDLIKLKHDQLINLSKEFNENLVGDSLDVQSSLDFVKSMNPLNQAEENKAQL